MRVLVVGTSGAGKSTFARALAQHLAAPYIELDELHWSPNWTPRPPAEFIHAVDEATRGERWVVDGNYGAVRALLWPRATHVVWLNFGRAVVFPRIVWRTLRRALGRQTLWHGNRESFTKAFFSRESILLWSFSTFGRNRVKFAGLRQAREFAHLQWFECRRPAQARALLARLPQAPP
jgi:adenylate kinase family enzyme